MTTEPLNFLGLSAPFCEEKTAHFVVLPIPYEQTTTYGKGTAHGPKAIIEASQQVELYDEELGFEPYTMGVYTAPDIKPGPGPHETLEAICWATSDLLEQGLIPVALGGEHSLTVGMVRAFIEKFKDLTILQLDAHADLREQYLDSKWNHACTARRLMELAPVVPVGIRNLSKEEAEFIQKRSLNIFYAQEVRRHKPWDEVIARLSQNVYVTIDLDVFDSGIMPSVGTPEPGGLDWYEVLELIRLVAHERTIVGFDVVELCPQPGNIAPDFLAAKLVYKVIGYIVDSAEG
jgi:agmatinase